MKDLAALDDRTLVLLLRDGKEAALKEIYARYWEKLLAIGYYHMRDKQAAEDIVAEVLSGLWFKRSNLDIQSLSAYLGTAVKYSVFKAILRQQRREELLQDRPGLTNTSEDETEKKLEALFLREFVDGVIEQLPEKTRLVFTYSRDQQLSAAEIAGKLELSPKSVEYHITRALRTLREKLRKFNIFQF